MIRKFFKVDPWGLSDNDFTQLADEALWLRKDEVEVIEMGVKKAVNDALIT